MRNEPLGTNYAAAVERAQCSYQRSMRGEPATRKARQ